MGSEGQRAAKGSGQRREDGCDRWERPCGSPGCVCVYAGVSVYKKRAGSVLRGGFLYGWIFVWGVAWGVTRKERAFFNLRVSVV